MIIFSSDRCMGRKMAFGLLCKLQIALSKKHFQSSSNFLTAFYEVTYMNG